MTTDAEQRQPTPSFALWLALPAATAPGAATNSLQIDQARPDCRDLPHSAHRPQAFSLSRRLLRRVAAPVDASISLSHSTGHAALVVGPPNHAIGVDIEPHRARNVLSIAQFAFDPHEVATLQSLPSPQRERWFYSLWVMKEALAKALELELIDALRQCVFVPRGEEQGWLGRIPTRHPWSVALYEPLAGWSLAFAQVGEPLDNPVRTFEWREPNGNPLGAGHELTNSRWPKIAVISS